MFTMFASTRYDFLVKDKDMQFIKLPPEKIKLGLTIFELVHPEDRNRFLALRHTEIAHWFIDRSCSSSLLILATLPELPVLSTIPSACAIVLQLKLD
jgi:hypothetical protein